MGVKHSKNNKNGRLTAQERRLINRRLRALKLAAKLGNVSEACRRCNMDRPSFYKYQERYAKHGPKGLLDLSRAPHRRPRSIKPLIKRKILSLALKHARSGCRPIANMLASENIPVSHETVRNYLAEKGMSTIAERQKMASIKRDKLALL